jgi:hypothetical protein
MPALQSLVSLSINKTVWFITDIGVQCGQGDQKIRKNAQFFKKLPKKSPSQKKAKISTTKLILKAQNIYIKPLFKPLNTHNEPCFETGYLGENVINLLKQKVD